LIGKFDFSPISSKRSSARNEYESSIVTQHGRISQHSSFDSAVPLTMNKLFALSGRVSGLTHSLSAKGITNKNLIVGYTSGQITSLDLRLLNPRRPLQEPTQSGFVS
jgi:hypothetical protein